MTMDTCSLTWTPGYDQFGRIIWYNKAAGRVHRPLQPPGHGPHRCQVQPGLSMTCGHQAKRSDVYDEQSTVAKGSYYNPLAADMAEWGIWFQPPRSDSARTPWLGKTSRRKIKCNNPRALGPKKMLKKPPQTKPLQERTRVGPALNELMPPPPPVARLQKSFTQ